MSEDNPIRWDENGTERRKKQSSKIIFVYSYEFNINIAFITHSNWEFFSTGINPGLLIKTSVVTSPSAPHFLQPRL